MRHLHTHPLEYVALFLALSGVTWAAGITPKNSVGSNSIRNGAVSGQKLAPSAVTGADVADGSLGGADLSSAALADHSLGRSATNPNLACQPPTATTCATVTLNLGAPARVLVLADGTPDNTLSDGACQLTADGAGLSYGNDNINGQGQDTFGLTDVTGVLAAGSHTFTMICSANIPGFQVENTHISAVSLSAS